jgi:DNA-binding transcriptional regulator GbsR (MarR family)
MAKQQGQSHPEQYVSSPAGGIDLEAGAAVDEYTQQRITKEAKAKAQKDVAQHLSILERLEEVLTSQLKGRNLTTQGEMKQARAQIKRAKRKIEGQAKALEAAEEGA